MTLCTACGAENMDGTKFCVRCGAQLAPAPDPGAWRGPSGNLYDQQQEEPTKKLSSEMNNAASYVPPPVSYSPYSTPQPQGAWGVASQMNYAQWGDRVIAALIDGSLVAVVMFVLYFVLGGIGLGLSAGGNPEGIAGAIGGSFCCLAMFLAPVSALLIGLYNKVYLLTTRGSSIGQGLMKLKVVNGDGSLLTTGMAMLRLLVQMGFGFIPFVGWIVVLINLLWPLWDPQRQTLHDKAVGSFVIKNN